MAYSEMIKPLGVKGVKCREVFSSVVRQQRKGVE
jgi:hypothetical protein